MLACVVLGGTAHAERPGGPGGPDPYERVACGGARAGADELGGQLGGQRDDDLRALGPDLEAGLDADLDADPREPGDAGERRDAGARAVLRLRGAPAIAEVLEAAYRASGLDGDPSRGWIRRARVSGLVPWVSVRTGWNASWREEDPDVGRSRAFEVRATWRLDRLLFDGRELQIASIEAARRRERRRLASYVIRAYFTWRRLAAAAMRSAARYGLAAAAAAAELDALTDGWFSDRAKSAR